MPSNDGGAGIPEYPLLLPKQKPPGHFAMNSYKSVHRIDPHVTHLSTGTSRCRSRNPSPPPKPRCETLAETPPPRRQTAWHGGPPGCPHGLPRWGLDAPSPPAIHAFNDTRYMLLSSLLSSRRLTLTPTGPTARITPHAPTPLSCGSL